MHCGACLLAHGTACALVIGTIAVADMLDKATNVHKDASCSLLAGQAYLK
jgi:hypothetical protein